MVSVVSERARIAGLAGLSLCIFAFWAVLHPYSGLANDGTLYAVAALARLTNSLGHDIFLSQGSQDHYTIFSPIAAMVIRCVGVAKAAALLTLIAQAGFFGCAWLLARRLMAPSQAILATALLVALPGIYGGHTVFSYAETVLAPRVPAEALVLASLAATLSRRYVICGACLLGAALLHPLMAAAGWVMQFLILVGIHRPRVTVALALSGLVVLVLVAYATPIGPLTRFDPEWFAMLHSRLQYAFPSLWSRADWGHASVPLATLAVGALSTRTASLRRVCCAALVTGLCGLAVSLLASDLLHIVLVAQVQTWRWMWLANVVAVLTMAVTAQDCWEGGKAARAAILLLAGSWICLDQSLTLVTAPLAVIVAAVAHRVTDDRRQRLILFGAQAALALCVLIFFGSVLTALRKPASTPLQVDAWLRGGVIPASVLTLAWWWTKGGVNRAAVVVLPALGIGLCVLGVRIAWPTWANLAPSQELRAQFDPWRRQIPPTAQVLAPGVPLIPWFMLERPSYWSLRQMAGVMFSRPTTMELLRRESSLLDQEATGEPGHDLAATCRNNPLLEFIVSPADMGPTSFAPVSIDKTRPGNSVRLYRCADYRG
jgi:hypothetical protein